MSQGLLKWYHKNCNNVPEVNATSITNGTRFYDLKEEKALEKSFGPMSFSELPYSLMEK